MFKNKKTNNHDFLYMDDHLNRQAFATLLWNILFKIWSWFLSFHKKTIPNTLAEAPVLTPMQQYIAKQKLRFESTFREGQNAETFNQNMASLLAADIDKELVYAENEIEKAWRRRILMENTPRGNVIMFYDAYKQGFAYYCDQSVMPHDLMNAVAMKYVLTFSCRDLFVCESVEEKKEPQEKKEPAVAKKDDNLPFAKFKSYNTAQKKVTQAAPEKKVNKFLYLGPTRNVSVLNVPPKKFKANGFATNLLQQEQTKPTLSYAEFKARQLAQQQKQQEEQKE
jgi:hypothetical protein